MSMAALAGVLCESDVVCWCNVGEGGADKSAMFDDVSEKTQRRPLQMVT